MAYFSRLLVGALCLFAMSSPVSAQTAPAKSGITLDRLMKSGAKQFAQLDTNHDGIVDEAEWAAHVEALIAKLRASQAKRWAEMDTKSARKITQEDFLAARAKWFAEVDSDNSGVIDSDKIRKFNFRRSRTQPE